MPRPCPWFRKIGTALFGTRLCLCRRALNAQTQYDDSGLSGLQPGPLSLESSACTIRPLHYPHRSIRVWTIASIWRENMLGYLSADIICFETPTVFQQRSSRKTVSFEEQIMSRDKYRAYIFAPNGGYCLYYPSNIFKQGRFLFFLLFI